MIFILLFIVLLGFAYTLIYVFIEDYKTKLPKAVVVSKSKSSLPAVEFKGDEKGDWLTYSDKNHYFTVKYPSFAQVVDVEPEGNNRNIVAYITISYSTFQLSIKVKDNSMHSSIQQIIEDLKRSGYIVSNTKFYKNAEIDGISYKALNQTNGQTENIEGILQIHKDKLYWFEYNSPDGVLVSGEGKKIIDKVLATIKLL